MTDEPKTLEALHAWLLEKHARGVKDVRVATLVALMDALPKEPKRRGLTREQRLQIMEEELVAQIGCNPVTYETEAGLVHVSGPILGTAEVAAELGVERPRVGRWESRRRAGVNYFLPAPLGRGRSGPYYLRAQVERVRESVESRKKKPRQGVGATDST